MADNSQVVADLLREYGQAFRGDWSDVDGRWVETDMGRMAQWLHPVHAPVHPLFARNELDLCQYGHGHWTQWCDESCKDDNS